MEPLLSLALTLHSNKGCYAVMLGSGVSRNAGIPTGWEVILDLSRRLATILGEDCEPDPAAWYRTKFGVAPDYGQLLDKIAKSPTERNQLLRPYFEPTSEEAEDGKKSPTAAHKAIARLVEMGVAKLIVTTNFDRLIERALEEVGVVPQVIASADAVSGALPLVHSRCTVVKLHGDYLDSRIKNSPAELESYDTAINGLLDRIFDEYGLIVCGWSAEWDVALRAAVERCKARRFSTYWVSRSELGEAAKALVALRSGSVIRSAGADEFFVDLVEKVTSLEEMNRPHPLSVKVAVATLKRFITRDEHRIQLADLVREEVDSAYATTTRSDSLKTQYVRWSAKEKLNFHDRALEIPLNLMIHGCYWGRSDSQRIWLNSVERMARSLENSTDNLSDQSMRGYAAKVLLYAGGLAALIGDQMETLVALLEHTKVRDSRDELRSVCYSADRYDGEAVIRKLPDWERRRTPVSDHVHSLLREPIRELQPDDREFDLAFDRFELYRSLTIGRLQRGYMPLGRFGWRRHSHVDIYQVVMTELDAQGSNWKPFAAGFLGGDVELARKLLAQLLPSLERIH